MYSVNGDVQYNKVANHNTLIQAIVTSLTHCSTEYCSVLRAQSSEMWESTEAGAYAKKLLTSALPRLTALDKFNMLRSVSITSAGMRAYGEGTMSNEQLEAKVLKHYLEVIVLDVARHQKGLAENLTVDMMSQRSLKLKRITKRIQRALDTKSKKAKLKNEVPPEEGLYSGIEGNDLYAVLLEPSPTTPSIRSG